MAEPTCFCGALETLGNGRFVTLTFKTQVRAVKSGWADTRQVSGYLETCDTCGDQVIMDDDGTVKRLVRETDSIKEVVA